MFSSAADLTVSLERHRIVDAAREWLGTPFHHEARVKGPQGGVDCGQLLIAVYGECGYAPRDYRVPHYSFDFAIHRNDEWYLNILQEFGREITESEVGPGDAVLFKIGRLYSHGAIVVDWPRIIHASPQARVVLEWPELYQLSERPRRFFSAFAENG